LNIEDGRAAMRCMLTQHECPTAVFVNNNLLTLGSLLAIQELGLRCPEDIAVVAFDDHPWAAVAHPPLTVVNQPSRQVGQAAAHIMLDLIDGKPPAEPRVILDCHLIVRQSC
jgi:LacI family transcriptional regulator